MTSNHSHNERFEEMSGLRGSSQPSPLVRAAEPARLARDSIGQPRGGREEKRSKSDYVTTLRTQSISQQLTDQDRLLLDVLHTVHLATGQQLQRLIWGDGPSDARSARRQLRGLTDIRILARLERRPLGVRGGSLGYVYALDVVGQAITGVPRRRRRPRLPGMAFLDHAVAVTDCYLKLRQLESTGRIELVHFQAEPRCWRSFVGPGGYQRLLKPDSHLITGCGDYLDHWFLEIDRATESKARLHTKIQAYTSFWQSGREQADTDVFPKVLWIVPDDKRLAQLAQVIQELPDDERRLHQICTDDNFTTAIVLGPGSEEQ